MQAPSSRNPPKRLILFDLDGVLWDSRENMRRSWMEVQSQLGVAPSFDQYFRLIGRPFRDIMAELGLQHRAADCETVYRVASMENMGSARFYPGVDGALERLASVGVKLGIVTSKDDLRTSAILAMLPVTFDVVRTPSASGRGKPAPDHLLAAMALAEVDPVDTMYIGDMDADCEAASRAQVDYAHASWGYGAPPQGCRLVLREIADLDQFAGAFPAAVATR
jgi:phosphoglycolate phosphatase